MGVSLTSKSLTEIKIVERATANLPQSTDDVLFTISGRVLLLQIVGEVTTVIQAQANATKLIANPTVGASVDLCATEDINADAVGTLYSITGTFADAMVATTSAAATAQVDVVVLADGEVELECAASNTGAVKWVAHYIPLDPGSSMLEA